MARIHPFLFSCLLLLASPKPCASQSFGFTSGPIPTCDTSVFTATVSGIGWIVEAGSFGTGYALNDLWINITTDHPQTLKIYLTSPYGTVLLLSQFNGAGGQNYTDTHFDGSTNIAGASAPFTGSFRPQAGISLGSAFAGEYAEGTWTVTVIDTACANGGTGPGGTWTTGWFSGGAGGGMGFGWNDGWQPTCWHDIGSFVLNACPGQPVDLLGAMLNTLSTQWGWPGGTYSISFSYDPNSDPIADPSAVSMPGQYSMDVWVDDNSGNGTGCTYHGVFLLVPVQGVQLGPDQAISSCADVETDLTALFSDDGSTRTWYFGGAVIPAPTAATQDGPYTVVATVPSGCTDTAMVTLNILPAVTLGGDQALNTCGSQADLTALYPTAGLMVTWTLNGQPVPDPSAITDNGMYRLVAGNSQGCTDTAFVTVTLNPLPQLGTDQSFTACMGQTVDIASAFNTAGLTTTWTVGGAAVTDPSAVGTPGTYVLVASNTAGCSDTAQAVVTINPAPQLGPDQSITACTGQTVDLAALFPAAPPNSAWTNNGTPVADPTAVASGGSYALIAITPEGCADTAYAALTFVPGPDLGPDQALTICSDSMVNLDLLYPTTGLMATWTTASGTVTYTNGVALPGTYQLVVSNGACTDTAIVELTVNAVPQLGADQSFTLCPWQTVDLTNLFPTDGLGTMYNLNGQAVANPDSVHDAGIYSVTATNASGCSTTVHAIITNVDCICQAGFTTDARCLQEPAHFTLLADSAVLSVAWDFDGAAPISSETDPEVRFGGAGDVLVKMQARLSCGVINVERIIHIQDCADSCRVWFPNSFTPDNDGKNDTWNCSSACLPDPFAMTVFDRWGKALFTTTDPAKGWDGTASGTVLPPGVYMYRAKYQLPYQDEQEVKGTITLVR